MCIFCKIVNKEIPSKILYEDENILAILDLSQVTLGHTLVIPKKHYKHFLDADEKTVTQVMRITHTVANNLVQKLQAQGCNILANCNEVAGQTVDHFHVHIIPRYSDEDAIAIKFNQSNIDIEAVYHKINQT